MNPLFAKCRSRGLSAFLAVLILLGSVAALSGVCIVRGPDHPQVTLDVCHPLQALNGVSQVFLAHPDPVSFPEPALHFKGTIPDRSKHKLIALVFAPDPPPPKASV
jgi:hypothetical protein